MGVPAHSSFILPKTFCLRLNKVDALSGSHSCRTDFVSFDVFVDVVRFDLKQEAISVCVQELALGAVLFFQLVVEKCRTSGSCCCQGSSSRCRQVCSESACFCACRFRPGRLKT